MKRILFALSLLCTLSALAQEVEPGSPAFYQTYCRGWHNPTNFTLVGGDAQTHWNGRTGYKTDMPGNAQIGVPWINSGSTVVEASSLATTVSSGYCTTNYQSTSLDYSGQQDTYKRFVIKGRGTAPETSGNLTYTPSVYDASGNSYVLDTHFTSSIRLGNYCGGGEAEALQYSMEVRPQNALLTLWFAMSAQPGYHEWDVTHQRNATSELVVYVEVQDYGSYQWRRVGQDTLFFSQLVPPAAATDAELAQQGFCRGATTSNGIQNFYSRWNKLTINLYKYLYQQIRITISAGDCSMTAHYGLVYLAGDCAPMALESACASGSHDTVSLVSAPKGMHSYQWYRSRYGVLSWDQARNLSNYDIIPGATSDTYGVTAADLQNNESTLLCWMRSMMNLNAPTMLQNEFVSIQVTNRKPQVDIDSMLFDCEGNVTLQDISRSPLSGYNEVDTALTEWVFFESPVPTPGETPVCERVGGIVSAHFDTPNHHRVRVKSHALLPGYEGNRTCWNEKDIVIRSLQKPDVTVDYTSHFCDGDTIAFLNTTEQAVDGVTYSAQSSENVSFWSYTRPDGTDTTICTPTSLWVPVSLDGVEEVMLTTYLPQIYKYESNELGILARTYCRNSRVLPLTRTTPPEVGVDTLQLDCSGRIVLQAKGTEAGTGQPHEGFDPEATRWFFYDSPEPLAGELPVGTATGAVATAHFDSPGHHRAHLQVSASPVSGIGARACRSEADVVVRTMQTPEVTADYDDVVYEGNVVYFVNTTHQEVDGVNYAVRSGRGQSQWSYTLPDGTDTVITSQSTDWRGVFDTSTVVTLTTYLPQLYWNDPTTGEPLYCYGSADFPVTVIPRSTPPTGIEGTETESLVLYPNPTAGMVSIQSPVSSIQSLELYDMQGRLVLTATLNAPHSTFNLTTLPSGLYFLRAVTPEGVLSQRVVKQ